MYKYTKNYPIYSLYSSIYAKFASKIGKNDERAKEMVLQAL